jgi:hypothetical protein
MEENEELNPHIVCEEKTPSQASSIRGCSGISEQAFNESDREGSEWLHYGAWTSMQREGERKGTDFNRVGIVSWKVLPH